MTYYYFENSIDKESITELVQELQQIDDDIILYFCTTGGETCYMDYLIDYLNNREKTVKIVVSSFLISAGTRLLTDFKDEIILHDNLDFILFHKFDLEGYTLRKSDSISHKIRLEQVSRENKIFAEKLKSIGLNTKQIKMFNSGKDVVLYKKDFKNLKF